MIDCGMLPDSRDSNDWNPSVAQAMSGRTTDRPDTEQAETTERRISFLERRERTVILFLCALAALRVFIFSAAFPVFTNVDEQLHFDTVCKYAHLEIPRGVSVFHPEAKVLTVIYGSCEYSALPPNRTPPRPLWTLPREDALKRLRVGLAVYEGIVNTEATQPPVYYALAGIWYDFGKLLGFRGGALLHWLRTLDAPVYALLVWLSYVYARRFFPISPLMKLGVPLMVALFPQDVFYSMNNDVLSPLMFGAALYCLLVICVERAKGYGFYALAGLLTAAAFLVKFSNVAILVALVAVVCVRLSKSRRSGALKAEASRTGLLALAAAVPLAAWLVRSQLVSGDITGSAAKLAELGWTLKPLSRVFDHPVFTPAGIATFWNEFAARFWRGEIVWGGRPLGYAGVDLLYAVTSALFVAASVAALFVYRRKLCEAERASLGLSAVVFGVSLIFMLVVSVAYDFGGCLSPSRQHPFLTHGRLISGTLIPFMLLYVNGLDVLLGKGRRPRVGLGILVAVVCIVTVSEIVLSMPAFRSPYNFYHMIFRS
jgi:hypothetical protein